MSDNYSLYMHTAPNGKRYIGITSMPVEQRWRNGRGYRSNKHFTNSVKKYGWVNFTHEVFLQGLTKEDAEERERFYIELFRSTDRRFGYNIESGGNLGKDISDESRRKNSEAHIGLQIGEKNGMYGKHHSLETRFLLSKQKSGSNHPWYGKHLPDETKKKISESQLGKSRPEEAVRKMRETNIRNQGRKIVNSDTGERFDSIGEAAKKYGVSKASIKDCLHGRTKTCCKCRWEFCSDGDSA